eukprot:914384-Prymnesium_polylepis.1
MPYWGEHANKSPNRGTHIHTAASTAGAIHGRASLAVIVAGHSLRDCERLRHDLENLQARHETRNELSFKSQTERRTPFGRVGAG